mmetsp:Transcript_40738/g.103185  ORF Transcript_40738/g.103185 Transcript_40738/m.103185 type:complete len:386 (-) Transcript_40738:269-1426(-)
MMQKSDFDDAIRELTATLVSFPQSARAHLDRGICHYRLKNLDSAILDFTRAIELQREMYLAYANRARVFLEQRRYPEAIADCKAAMAINSENPEAYAIKMDAEDKLEAEEGDDTVSDVFASPCKHRERKICVVCMDEDRGCRLQPCMHAALCVDCASQLKERGFTCPICDSAIDEVEPGIFMDTFAFGDVKTLNSMIAAVADVNANYSPLGSPGMNTPLMNSPTAQRASWSSSRAITPQSFRQPSPLAASDTWTVFRTSVQNSQEGDVSGRSASEDASSAEQPQVGHGETAPEVTPTGNASGEEATTGAATGAENNIVANGVAQVATNPGLPPVVDYSISFDMDEAMSTAFISGQHTPGGGPNRMIAQRSGVGMTPISELRVEVV